jgi:hypothetical protein
MHTSMASACAEKTEKSTTPARATAPRAVQGESGGTEGRSGVVAGGGALERFGNAQLSFGRRDVADPTEANRAVERGRQKPTWLGKSARDFERKTGARVVS